MSNPSGASATLAMQEREIARTSVASTSLRIKIRQSERVVRLRPQRVTLLFETGDPVECRGITDGVRAERRNRRPSLAAAWTWRRRPGRIALPWANRAQT